MEMTISLSEPKANIHIPKNEFVLYRLTQERLEKQIKESKSFNEKLPYYDELYDFVKQVPDYIHFHLHAKFH